MKTLIVVALLISSAISNTVAQAVVLFERTARQTTSTALIPYLGADTGAVFASPSAPNSVIRITNWSQVTRFPSLGVARSSTFTITAYRSVNQFVQRTNELWKTSISGDRVSANQVGSDQGGPLLKIGSHIPGGLFVPTGLTDAVFVVDITPRSPDIARVLWHASGQTYTAGSVFGIDVTGPEGPQQLAAELSGDALALPRVEITTLKPYIHVQWSYDYAGWILEGAADLNGPWQSLKTNSLESVPVWLEPATPSRRFFRLRY